MATKKPYGDDARKGAARDRSQSKTRIEDEGHWTKRNTTSGEFGDQKKDSESPNYKDIRWDAEPTD